MMYLSLDPLALELHAARRTELLRAQAPSDAVRVVGLRRRIGLALVGLGTRLAPEEAAVRGPRMRPAAHHH
ncbi:MAG TPA: hypothetical protein VHK28_10295 [Candidatus Limnocylindria bacterium]|nr:hypothetical protein [Candidatus Limnocylindria bacterium]